MTLHDPNLSHDPDRLVGELFRRLSSLKDLGIDEANFSRAVQAALVALGRAAHEEGERRAKALAERTGPRPADVRVTAHARRIGDGVEELRSIMAAIGAPLHAAGLGECLRSARRGMAMRRS